jgi:hypothetical protein
MDLTQTFTNRLGGYNRIQIIKLEEFIASESPVWTNLQLTPGSIFISQPPKIIASGKQIPTKITGDFPDDDSEILAILQNFDQRKCMVRLRGNNGKEKQYGKPGNALRFSYIPLESKKTTDPTGYQILLSGTLIDDPIFIITE